MNISGKTVVILACASMVNGMVTKPNQTPSLTINRRETFGILGAATAAPFLPIANAEVSEETPRVTSRMGGLLVRLKTPISPGYILKYQRKNLY